jgi:hypothetical protein
VLVRFLPLFGRGGAAARRFGFSFPLGGVALSFGLVLLGLALAGEVILTEYASGRFLGLTLHAFDDAAHAFFGSTLLKDRRETAPARVPASTRVRHHTEGNLLTQRFRRD